MAYDIRTYGDPVLTSVAEQVENIDGKVVRLSQAMLQAMYQAPGLGLAAPQIGVQKQIFVYDVDGEHVTLLNPRIVASRGEWVYDEGCPSIPGGRPALPEGPEANPIDRFINAELRNRGLKAVGAADKGTLLRRVHLDLTGIPPSPAEQEAFLAEDSTDAYEKVVDQLLANEQHAVRYARHWLDVLRYADADERMTAAPGIHLWRDWVINALHYDVPYDQFVQIQLTGRRANQRTQMSATGFRSRKEPRPGDQFALGFLARGTGEHPSDRTFQVERRRPDAVPDAGDGRP